ncbi:hypothetical protein CesoFtcFv8_008108 [Champsocephalus esox]|uniref:Uncharacterized protein n=1 Tax=Champsocephalus esox TaxID=159716 RepID=A0AAN8CFP3_9TELE|nr:hypothetical protein CesoFtcFv8_008108 [Champsocephalus esox]
MIERDMQIKQSHMSSCLSSRPMQTPPPAVELGLLLSSTEPAPDLLSESAPLLLPEPPSTSVLTAHVALL